MRRVGFAVLLGLLLGCSSGPPAGPTASTTPPDTIDVVVPELADHGGKAFAATLFPPPGGDQAGTLIMSANGGQGEVCYALRYAVGVPTPTSVEIYRGLVNPRTGQVISLAAHGDAHACDSTSFSREFIRDLAGNPSEYGAEVYAGDELVLRGRFTHMRHPYR